jgi:hypothetical protein
MYTFSGGALFIPSLYLVVHLCVLFCFPHTLITSFSHSYYLLQVDSRLEINKK